MKVHQLFVTFTPARAVTQLSAFLISVGVLSVSCASKGYQKSDLAAASMQKAATEVQTEQRALDATVAALGELINGQNGDLSIPFKRYSSALDQLIGAAHRTEATGKNMQVKSAAYLDSWDRQLQSIDYQHIREVSEARRTEVTNRVETINQRYRDSQAVVQPLISYFEDIRTALSTDLTAAGLASLKEVVQNASNNVTKVQTALDALATELTDSSAKMSSVAYSASDRNSPQK
jgi:hypothetical protein